MARLRSPGFNASKRLKANWVLGRAGISAEAARWGRSAFDGLRGREKMEDIESFGSTIPYRAELSLCGQANGGIHDAEPQRLPYGQNWKKTAATKIGGSAELGNRGE